MGCNLLQIVDQPGKVANPPNPNPEKRDKFSRPVPRQPYSFSTLIRPNNLVYSGQHFDFQQGMD